MKFLNASWARLASGFGAALIAISLGLSAAPADAAKRMGGGKSVGQQSNNVKKDAAPATPAATPQAAPGAAAGAAAAATKKPWGAMLGGLAAGLGLAWLASSLGLGAAFGQFLMFALLALVIMVAVGFFMRKRAQAAAGNPSGQGSSPFALQGAGGAPVQRADYSPSNVGNDASARPWERNSMAFDATAAQNGGTAGAAGGSMIGANLRQATGWSIPADFDQTGFLHGARSSFVTLQAAWDKSDINTLRAMMTDDMLTEIRQQLAEREATSGNVQHHTEVAMLDAKLLGIEDVPSGWMASVEFSGMIREDSSAGPQPFREVWNMTKTKDAGSGWLVAGVQALG